MKITFKGQPFNTSGELPAIGKIAPDFTLTSSTLAEVKLSDFLGKRVILNIFPSIDTSVCATSVRTFNKEASSLKNTVVLCISKDLPFAQGRFCGAEGLNNVITLSQYKNSAKFALDFGVEIIDGPLEGLMSRAVLVLDENGKIVYREQVPEIAQEPAYDKALQSLS